MIRPNDELQTARANNMNDEEGHLGGYIRASSTPAPSGLCIEHGDPATWTPNLWYWVYEILEVRSVLDVGCGEGHGAGFFHGLGCKVLGVDGSRQAKRDSVIPTHQVVHDFVDGPYLPGAVFDLVWACEFVEHVDERYIDNFLATFRCSRQYVMMTFTPPGQPGWHHVNCQPHTYWIETLQRIDFIFAPALTWAARQVAEPGHFRHKGLVFVRDTKS